MQIRAAEGVTLTSAAITNSNRRWPNHTGNGFAEFESLTGSIAGVTELHLVCTQLRAQSARNADPWDQSPVSSVVD